MKARVEKRGELDCVIVDALPTGAVPRLIVVLCHGFGAPGEDLVPLGGELLEAFPALAESVQFVFPAAPLMLDDQGFYGGRAWWPLDLEERLRAIERGDLRILRNENPPGMSEAAALLTTAVTDIRHHTGLPTARVVLGGFSQGGMVATQVALTLPETPAALVVFSGTLLCETDWQALAAKRGAMPVLLSHGRQDPILPFDAAEWLRDLLTNAGLEVEFIPFQGPHTIPLPALQAFAKLLEKLSS